MRTRLFGAAIIAVATIMSWAGPAHAVEIPDHPVLLHLKDHPDLPLTWTDEGARLGSEGSRWSLKPVEALQEVGTYLIAHEDDGRCLTAAPMPDGAETAPVELVACAEATEWTVVFNDAPIHQDWRFTTPEGHFLGVDREAEVSEGAEVVVVDVPSSLHDQEWLFAPVPEETPPTEETTAPAEAQPKLPQTGVDVAILGGAALVAIAAGGVLTLWWRRRALRTHW